MFSWTSQPECRSSSSCLRWAYFKVMCCIKGDWWQPLFPWKLCCQKGCSNSHRLQVRSPTFSRFRALSSHLWTHTQQGESSWRVWSVWTKGFCSCISVCEALQRSAAALKCRMWFPSPKSAHLPAPTPESMAGLTNLQEWVNSNL